MNVLYAAGTIADLPLTADLSVCSIIIGLTAWYGINKILEPKAESLICVSGGAGAVGSLVGQLALQKGAKVIGIAGGENKCAWMKNLGFHHVIDYKKEDVGKCLASIAPNGIDGYFDNVGGAITDAVLMNMSLNSKIAVCGSISEYDDAWAGQRNWNMILMRRITIKGFICVDHIGEHMAEAKTEIAALVREGKVKYTEDVREGLENYPSVVRLLFAGENTGKLILKV